MKKKLLIAFACIAISFTSLQAQTTYTFNYTGSFSTYTVPANITIISVTVSGAQGGGGATGAIFQHTLGVTPGQILRIYCGGAGSVGSGAPGGFNGGGNAGSAYGNEGSGGGASDIRIAPYALSDRIIVAGGGGGNGGYAGGGGGYAALNGMAGGMGQGGGGGGGTSTAGGIGGFGNGCSSGTNGTLGNGGAGGGSCAIGGGGGGGGYYGGGGGGADYNYCCADGGGAGGGSSYCSIAGGTCFTGNNGAGKIILREMSGLSVTQISPIICNGQQNAALLANMSGGGAPYTYSWSTGATTSSITNLAAGTYTCWVTNTNSVTYSETYSITEPPALYSSLNWQSNVYCNAGSDGAASVYAYGGIYPYTYSWSPVNSNFANISSVPAGMYTCQVTDANNCVTTTTVNITQPPPINVVAFATSTAVCIGDYVTLIGGGASYYNWTNNVQDGVPFMPTSTSSYVVTGYDWNGCPGYAQTSVIVNPLPTVSVPAPSVTTCSGAPITLSALGAATYSWSNSTSGVSTVVSPTVPTTYTVTGTSTLGCNNTATVAVGIYTLPSISALMSNTAVCQGNTVTAIGLGAFTFTWSGGVTNGVPFTPTSTAIYTISGTNANGCVNSTTRTIVVNPIPVVTVTGPNAICLGASAVLSASGAAAYSWSNISNTASITVMPQSSTNYSVTGFSSEGCSNKTTFSITVNPSPLVTVSTTNTLLCSGHTLLLSGNGANTYTWLPLQTNTSTLSITPTVTTTYSLTGTSNGCNNTSLLTIVVIPSPTLTLSSSGIECALNPVTLSAIGASSYTWSNGMNTAMAIISPSASSWVSVTGSGINGCTKTDSIFQDVKPIPILNIASTNSIICEGETSSTLTVSGSNTFTWSTLETTSTIVVTPTASTAYTVSSLGSNGCSNSVSYMISVGTCIGIEEQLNNEVQVLIYPNPNNGIFTIEAKTDLKLRLVNSLGQLVRTLSLDATNGYSLQVRGLGYGIYFITSEKSDQAINKKIIITN